MSIPTGSATSKIISVLLLGSSTPYLLAKMDSRTSMLRPRRKWDSPVRSVFHPTSLLVLGARPSPSSWPPQSQEVQSVSQLAWACSRPAARSLAARALVGRLSAPAPYFSVSTEYLRDTEYGVVLEIRSTTCTRFSWCGAMPCHAIHPSTTSTISHPSPQLRRSMYMLPCLIRRYSYYVREWVVWIFLKHIA